MIDLTLEYCDPGEHEVTLGRVSDGPRTVEVEEVHTEGTEFLEGSSRGGHLAPADRELHSLPNCSRNVLDLQLDVN